jgi:hypothetical protein
MCYVNVLCLCFVFVFVCEGVCVCAGGGGGLSLYITSYEPYCGISTISLRTEIWSRNHKG